jgi:D-serine dehydratase
VLAKATNEEQGQAALIALKENFLREYGEVEKKYQIGLIGEQEQRVQEAEERMRLAKPWMIFKMTPLRLDTKRKG